MKETVAGEYVRSVAPPRDDAAALDGLRLGAAGLAARSQIVWGEHCSECAYPACYSACAFYDPRSDLNCRRFLHGIEDAGEGAIRIRFRKWGKLEGAGPARLLPYAQAERRERGSAVMARSLAALPAPFQVKRSLARRLNRVAAPRTGDVGVTADAFVLEGWSNDGCERAFTITFLQDAGLQDAGLQDAGLHDGAMTGEAPGAHQAHIALTPAYGRHVLPLGPIAAAIRLDRPYLVQIEPVGEAQGVDVTLSLADFVAFRQGAQALAAAAARTPAEGLAKVLVWDLDETLWTGTLAEDGAFGVAPRPEAVAAVVELDRRGVLQSIASKNDPDEALAALARFGLHDYFLHPQIGWGPKSGAVTAVAAALDLGLDSVVFIDDQPFERAEVRAAHPQVRTLAHGDVSTLLAHPWFAHPATEEAGRRRSLYQAEAARGRAAVAVGGDYLAFLRGSELVLEVGELGPADTMRVHELSQRTNQLNFTGAKLTLAEVERLAALDSRHARLTLRCADRWGDYGLIGFADLDLVAGEVAAVFMSCRVQRKRVEHAAFAYIARRMRAHGHAALRVAFRATERNGAAARMLEDLGFEPAEGGWTRPLDRPFADADVVRVDAPGRAAAAA